MGQHKALLKWNEQLTFIEKIIFEYQSFGIHSILITTNSILLAELIKLPVFQQPNIQLIENKFIEKGRLFSISLALKHVPNHHSLFIQNIDNPFVDNELLEKLSKSLIGNSYVNPSYEGKGGHPVLLSHEIVDQLRKVYDFTRSLRDFLQPFHKTNVESDNVNILRNINSPEDYINFCKSQS